ncbi:hypothetical protein J3Q64DRAFT_1807668 [Phycomyces blakesleeanus]|uniref:NADH pyrophosphatase-like N-terminal domain-containing protein n=1 Tax=Phycomyces blakesleeanus TaxID=4837 RepID=A0ABR3BGK7_PHYBL
MTPTQLFEAAAEGNLDFIRKHKEHYRDKNERGWTVLHFAARYGQLEVATFLSSQAGCDILAVNNEGKTAADVAEFWGHDKVSKVLKPPTPSVSNTQILEKDTSDSNNTLVSNFSQNITNFFAGSFLNRLSRYRNDYSILQRLAHSPQSKFILFSKLNPLFDKSNDNSVYLASYSEVASLVDMIYGENKNIEKAVSKDEPILVFLGVDERNAKGEEGVAYWALDVTPRGKCQESLEDLTKEFESRGLDFAPTLPKAFKIDMRLASVLAQARAMVDWNKRNAFCPGCGRVTASAEGGHKRVCPVPKEDESCISHNGGVHNFTYPRTGRLI